MAGYRLSEGAREDLIRIHQWGAGQYGESQADSYFLQFFKHFEQLSEQPMLFPAVDHIREGYRRSVCGVDSVYYRTNGDTVEIMAIIGQQLW